MSELEFSFSEARLRNLEIPAKGKRIVYRDERSPGLILIQTDTGTKTFYTYAWMKTKNAPERIIIGRFPDISIISARKLNAENRNQMARGINPNEVRRAQRAEVSLGDHFNWCLESVFKQHNKSWREYQAIYDRYLSKWSKRRLSEISSAEVQAHHAKLGRENGMYSANRMLQLLSSLFSKAVLRGFDKPNPCKGIRKFKETSRERYLEADEMQRFLKAVYEEENATVRDFVLIALLTGARRSNVLAMRWEEVNFERAEWYIPMTKNGQGQKVALSGEALRVLQGRKENGSQFVFPSESKDGYLSDPKKGWTRILDRAEIQNLRIHDLRRTLGSWQAATGASYPVIGKSLGHKSPSSTLVYARIDLDPVRSAVEKATDAMLIAGGVRQPKKKTRSKKAEVIPFAKFRNAGGM
jgi:integrase